jgi:hypothetical protein
MERSGEMKTWTTTAVIVAVALLGCNGNDPAAGSKGSSKEAVDPGKKSAAERVATPKKMAKRAAEPKASVAKTPLPAELAGVWVKTDGAYRGLKIEFTFEDGLDAVKIVTPPPVDEDLIDLMAKRRGGDRKAAEKEARCSAEKWKTGEPLFKNLAPSGTSSWTGSELAHVSFTGDSCLYSTKKAMRVRLELSAPDKLVVTSGAAVPGGKDGADAFRKVGPAKDGDGRQPAPAN